MDFALRYCRQNFKPLFMVSLDIAKAFDLDTRNTIEYTPLSWSSDSNGRLSSILVLGKIGYASSLQKLEVAKYSPTCGVKQVDPLSPIIFNLVRFVRLTACFPNFLQKFDLK